MQLKTIGKYTVILSILPALYNAFFQGKVVLITLLCTIPLLIILILSLNKKVSKNFDGILFIRLFIIYYIVVLIRGLFGATSYTDWTVLFSNTIPLILIVHFTLYIGAYQSSILSLIRTFLFYGIPLCIILYLIAGNDPTPYGFSHMIAPISFMLFLTPYIGKKWRIIIFSVAIFSFMSDFENRSNLLNILLAFVILTSFIFRKVPLLFQAYKSIRAIALILPVLFLFLGISGVFNIFLVGDYLEAYNNQETRGTNEDVLGDSRTGIYQDVFSQLQNDDSVIFGLGSSGKVKSYLADYDDSNTLLKEGRRNSESGMLNYIQWGGLVGGLLYFLLFVKASYCGIYKSKNWLSKMLGMWLVYKGAFSFIEDPMFFSIGSIFIFFTISICLNKEFRLLSDSELRAIFSTMFNQRRKIRINYKST